MPEFKVGDKVQIMCKCEISKFCNGTTIAVVIEMGTAGGCFVDVNGCHGGFYESRYLKLLSPRDPKDIQYMGIKS